MSQSNLTHANNPFARGFQSMATRRLMAISTDPGTPLLYRPLHPSQAHVPDEQLNQWPVSYGDEFALKPEESYEPPMLLESCPYIGWVQTVVHALTTEVDGKTIPVCGALSNEAAQGLIQRMRFDNGIFSRCWEISTAHVCQESLIYLHDLMRSARPNTKLFDVFGLPTGNLIGIKLLDTPWSDSNLQSLEGKTALELRVEHERSGMPSMLLNVLHLAGEADVRFLFLDPDGFMLDGLPVHDEDDIPPNQGEFSY